MEDFSIMYVFKSQTQLYNSRYYLGLWKMSFILSFDLGS